MLRVKVDHSGAPALHNQVTVEIRRAIANGEAWPGERLSLARDLATVLKVNTDTVLRTLRLLRDEELLEFRPDRSITVAGGARQKSAVLHQAQELVHFARHEGYRREELIRMIESLP